MDFIVNNWVLIAVAFLSGGMLVWPLVQRSAGGAGSVDVTRAVQLINREKAVVIDVCEPQEFAQGHIGGARNVPLGSLESAGASLPSNKATPLVVSCPRGARASRAAVTLRKLGHQQVYVLAGGNAAWHAANLPLEKSTK